MFESNRAQIEEADRALSIGLRALDVPPTGADFKERVHAALQPAAPWWRSILFVTRQVFVTACCSLAVALAILWSMMPAANRTGTSISPGSHRSTGFLALVTERALRFMDLRIHARRPFVPKLDAYPAFDSELHEDFYIPAGAVR